MVVGAGLIAVARISAGRADDAYLSAMLLALARSLGLDPVRAEALLSEPVSRPSIGGCPPEAGPHTARRSTAIDASWEYRYEGRSYEPRSQ